MHQGGSDILIQRQIEVSMKLNERLNELMMTVANDLQIWSATWYTRRKCDSISACECVHSGTLNEHLFNWTTTVELTEYNNNIQI